MTQDTQSRFHLSRLINPIIIKEMRGQMRGPRAFRILTCYLVGLALLAYGLYRVTVAGAEDHFGEAVRFQSAYIGQTLFVGLALLEMAFVCFITPALTSGSISSETERRTYDMLLATPLRPVSVVWGKLFASLTYAQLLILAAIPLASVVYVFGGVALRDVVQTIGLLVLTAIAYGTLGVFFSALTRRTGPAMALSYLVVLCLVGSHFAWAVADAMGIPDPPRPILYANPISALASAILTPDMVHGMQGTTPTVRLLFLIGGWPHTLGFQADAAPARPIWQYTVVLYLAMTVLLYLLTAQLVKPIRRWRVGCAGAIGALFTVALLVAGVLVTFRTAWGSTGWYGRLTPTPPTPQAAGWIGPMPTSPPPPPMPSPTPIPIPTPVPFNADAHVEAMESYMEQSLLSTEEGAFCDLEILDVVEQMQYSYADVYLWVYCRTFRVADGELVPGLSVSAPAGLAVYWEPGSGWQFGGIYTGGMDLLSAEARQRLLDTPYDESAGGERLQERARQELLGD